DWDDEMLKLLGVPRAVLPAVLPSAGALGETSDLGWLPRGVPVTGIAGDQQAALFGQACHAPGAAKNTYGTGCFMLLNTGTTPVASSRGLLTTIAWRINGRTTYALEGRDGMGAVAADAGIGVRELRVVGGAVANDFLCQFQADIMNVAVLRPSVIETTALGAAYLAGLGAGVWRSLDDLGRRWTIER